MSNAIKSLIATGTKLYLDSVDPKLVEQNIEWGAVGATSNPIIISELIKKGAYDSTIADLIGQGKSDYDICWQVNNEIVQAAQDAFLPIWEKTKGNAGWVSFEIDPLLEDTAKPLPHKDRVEQYIELGRKWSKGHKNRMIKVPATPAGIEALETLAASGVTLNVTLIFSERQYIAARDSVWKGAQRLKSTEHFKSVFSIFVSRIDVYTQQHFPSLSKAAQGQYGILNAKRLFALNHKFWQSHKLPVEQEIIFASTGTKNPEDPPTKYVAALAGSDIQTNPPATNDAVASSDMEFESRVYQLPPDEVVQELDNAISDEEMEKTLMEEGLEKFASPQKKLLATVKQAREQLQTSKA